MLHVHGGSILLENLRAAGVPGDRLEWGETLSVGPTPAGLAPDAWRATRAAFLEATSGIPHILPALAAADRRLEQAAREEDEIVLWFGPELFCQAILIALLDRLAGCGARLSLVSLDYYPGVEDHRGCTPSYLNASQLLQVFRMRPWVTPAQHAQAREAWAAWCHSTPEPLAAQDWNNPDGLPYLADALRRQLEELPGPVHGLSRTEHTILAVLEGKPLAFGELFRAVQEREERPWLTDVILLDTLRRLSEGRVPLLEPPAPGGGWEGQMRVRRTSVGAEVAAGARDAVRLNGIDRWVGGTHLTPDSCWRWDTATASLIPPTSG
ncbi:MAG TPA: hypothetical protein VMH88_09620 [Gemmatimonadales bacterium]|nr:hypothetical protein [Gemmatimonadales bacterium]